MIFQGIQTSIAKKPIIFYDFSGGGGGGGTQQENWSEPLLAAHTTLLEISCTGSIMFVLHHFDHADQSNNIQQVYYLKGIHLVQFIGVAPITHIRMCVIKIATFKGGHLMW